MNISNKQIKEYVLAQSNNIFSNYYWQCPLCFKTSNNPLSICKIQDNYLRHRINVHPRMKATPTLIHHIYKDITYLTREQMNTLSLSFVCSKRYASSKLEEDVYTRCKSYLLKRLGVIDE